jgi:hypothetical protein
MGLHDLDDLVDRGPSAPPSTISFMAIRTSFALGLANRFVESIRSRPARRRIQM